MGIGAVLLKSAKYAKRALNIAPEFILGESSELVGKAARKTKGSIFTKVKAGALALEKDVAAKKAANGGFLKRLWRNSTHMVQDIYKDTEAAKMAAMKKAVSHKEAIARMAAKSSKTEKAVAKAFVRKSTLKGLGKGILKKMPLIGQILTIALEVPNIYRAFRDEGVGTGLKETAWAAGELGGFAAGAAAGTAICPGVGTVIGGIIGGIGVALFRGETYSDKKGRLKEEYGFTDEEISNAQAQGYTVDKIVKELESTEDEFFSPKSSTDKKQGDSEKTQDKTKVSENAPEKEDETVTETDAEKSEESKENPEDDTTAKAETSTTDNTTNPAGMSGFPFGMGTSNPFGGMGGIAYNSPYMSNPAGMSGFPCGMGMGNPFGMSMYNDPVTAQLAQGKSLFEIQDFGYRFQYMG